MTTSLPILDLCPRNQRWRVFNDLPEVSCVCTSQSKAQSGRGPYVKLARIGPSSTCPRSLSGHRSAFKSIYCLQLLFTPLITLRLPDSTNYDHCQLAIYIAPLSLQIARNQATVQLQQRLAPFFLIDEQILKLLTQAPTSSVNTLDYCRPLAIAWLDNNRSILPLGASHNSQHPSESLSRQNYIYRPREFREIQFLVEHVRTTAK